MACHSPSSRERIMRFSWEKVLDLDVASRDWSLCAITSSHSRLNRSAITQLYQEPWRSCGAPGNMVAAVPPILSPRCALAWIRSQAAVQSSLADWNCPKRQPDMALIKDDAAVLAGSSTALSSME